MQNAQPLINSLQKLEPPKTWSLIATVFGDLDADALSGKELGVLLGNIGIKPEAIRVALHRLKQDDWIMSHKSGREMIYTLSPAAREETNSVHNDIYRRDVKFAAGWQVVVLEGDRAPEPGNGACVVLSRSLVLQPVDIPGDLPNGWVLDVGNAPLPDWVEACLMPQHLAEVARGLVAQTERFAKERIDLSVADQVSARLLFLHHWRKLALRTATWAHIGLAPGGILAQCHRNVTELLAGTHPIKAPDL